MLMDGPSSPVQARAEGIRSALRGRAGSFKHLGMEACAVQGDGTYPTEKGGFFHLQKDLGMEYVSYPEGKVYWINLCGI